MAVTSAPRCALHATPPCCSRYAAAVKLPLQRRITACVPPFRVQGRGAALARGRWHATDAGEAPTLRLHARGAALALGRWRAHAANADDALKALESAGNPLGTGPVIVGVTPEDAETLDAILSAGAWEDVQQMVRSLATEGQLQPGVLVAAEKVLANALATGGPDSEIVRSLTSVTELLRATFDALARLAPKAKLAESLTQLDPDNAEERALMMELMGLAFAKEGMVDRLDFVEDMVFFLKSADEQDAGLLAAYAEGRVDIGDMTIQEVMEIRRAGRARMSAIVDMAASFE